ncbi:MAG: hypothetical protein MJ200_02280 [Mycoplasmoidaceae bacterium]|nr:hypothetical protein [Mycoplasmoidaceae bacterium]
MIKSGILDLLIILFFYKILSPNSFCILLFILDSDNRLPKIIAVGFNFFIPLMLLISTNIYLTLWSCNSIKLLITCFGQTLYLATLKDKIT